MSTFASLCLATMSAAVMKGSSCLVMLSAVKTLMNAPLIMEDVIIIVLTGYFTLILLYFVTYVFIIHS